ncbi:uncharacterized protein LOC127773843 isoform X3 [Oryza glaberrima]|uniref:uncharacterized protein LOC127773843 isoform X3 n=1 Tax=Oryza glaberrima TaxID=4538 RepID=UPI00224C411C|nr:uncharacterized protein LOC127773843 isoform X3 [Oryza glaberrima]
MPPIPSLTSQTLGWPKASSKMALLEQGVGVSSTMRCHGFEAPDPKPLRLFQSPAIKDFFPSLSLSSFSIVSDIIDRRSLCPRHGVGSRCRRKLPGLIHCRCGLMDLRCGPAAMSNTLLRRHRPEHQPCPATFSVLLSMASSCSHLYVLMLGVLFAGRTIAYPKGLKPQV